MAQRHNIPCGTYVSTGADFWVIAADLVSDPTSWDPADGPLLDVNTYVVRALDVERAAAMLTDGGFVVMHAASDGDWSAAAFARYFGPCDRFTLCEACDEPVIDGDGHNCTYCADHDLYNCTYFGQHDNHGH